MGIKYNPATGKLLRTPTPKLVNDCGVEPTCANTKATLTVSGIGNDPFGCGAACSALNTTFTLLQNAFPILHLSGCTPMLSGNAWIDDAQVCEYFTEFSACGGQTWRWDLRVYYKTGVADSGWVGILGNRSPGNYNFQGGGVASDCHIYQSTIGTIDLDPGPGSDIYLPGTGILTDFNYTFEDSVDLCGICGEQCVWFDVARMNATIQLI